MSEILFDTKFLQLKSTPSKSGKPWVYAHRPNAKDVVVILPYTDDEILFLIEERPPLQAEIGVSKSKKVYSVAFPAGLVGDEREGESVEDAIKAELLEEAGLKAEEIEIVSRCVASSPGCVSETVTIALAHILDKAQVACPIDDGGVIVDRIWVKRNNILNWFNNLEEKGYVLTSSVFSALFYLNEKERSNIYDNKRD